MITTLMQKIKGRFTKTGCVEEGRDRAFTSFYQGIQCGKLKPAEALNVWDRLESFEGQRELMLESRLSHTAVQELLVGYRYLVDYVGAVSRQLIHSVPRRSSGIHPKRFQWLYHGVRTGNITLEELKLGAYLLSVEPTVLRESAVVRALHAKLWGGAA
jgi:hypothetical protein